MAEVQSLCWCPERKTSVSSEGSCAHVDYVLPSLSWFGMVKWCYIYFLVLEEIQDCASHSGKKPTAEKPRSTHCLSAMASIPGAGRSGAGPQAAPTSPGGCWQGCKIFLPFPTYTSSSTYMAFPSSTVLYAAGVKASCPCAF